jgi:hypothetical protein
LPFKHRFTLAGGLRTAPGAAARTIGLALLDAELTAVIRSGPSKTTEQWTRAALSLATFGTPFPARHASDDPALFGDERCRVFLHAAIGEGESPLIGWCGSNGGKRSDLSTIMGG